MTMRPTERELEMIETCLRCASESAVHAQLARFALFLLLGAGEKVSEADGWVRLHVPVRAATVRALRQACLPLTGIDDSPLDDVRVLELLKSDTMRHADAHLALIETVMERLSKRARRTTASVETSRTRGEPAG